MIDIRVVGDDILVNGLKVAAIAPVESVSISELEEFRQTIQSDNRRVLGRKDSEW